MTEDSYIELKNRTNGNCFGCSQDNPVGLQMKFFAGKDKVVSDLVISPHLCGWNQFVHGGVLTTILDEVMSWSAMHFLKCMVVTKNIEIKFLKPALVDEPLQASGWIKKKTSRREVIMEGSIRDKAGKDCVRAEAAFAILSPEIAKRMGISEEEVAGLIT